MSRVPPPAQPHGDLQEVLPGVFFVTGSMQMGPMRISRNMTVLRQGGRLVLVNTVRLDEAGLAALDALGRVSHVIRLAVGHGSDDPFYKERYGAEVLALRGQSYFTGFDPAKGEVYFTPDRLLAEGDPLPVEGASLMVFDTKPSDGLLRLEAGGGTVIAGDCLQNWKADRHFNLVARVVMRLMGFLRPHQLGPGWVRSGRPDPQQIGRILELEFDNLLPAHGEPVLGGAKEKFRPGVERYAAGA